MATADDPGGRPDATGRRLAYLPAALLGNGELLVTLSARGEVERMLWPHVDGPDNVEALRLGVVLDDSVDWLDEAPAAWSQAWDGDASILRTTVTRGDGSVAIVDAVDPDEPVLVRRVEAAAGTLAVDVEPLLEGIGSATGAFVDPGTGIVVLHRRRAALAIAVSPTPVLAEVRSLGAPGDDVAHVAPLEAVVEVAHEGVAHVVAALAATPFEALGRARRHLDHAGEAVARRRSADARLLAAATPAARGDTEVAALVRRSVLVLEQLTDRATGGVVAAPEMDEGFAESGGYGFVWPRDLAYVVLGLLSAGNRDAAAAALRWLAGTQTPEGLWLHRYWTTGEPAPSWGLHQIDETGIVLLAVECAFGELGDEGLDEALWPVVRRAADLLVAFLEPATGLPQASTDLWEQHDGQHAYSAAAVAGGLRAAARVAARHEPARTAGYEAAAARVGAAIDARLWDEALGRYPEGGERRAARRRRRRAGPRVRPAPAVPEPSRRERRPPSTPASTARSSGSRGRSPLRSPPRACARPSTPSRTGSRRPTGACCGTRATPTAAATSGRSSPSGSASPVALSATRARPRKPLRTSSDGAPRSTSCPSRCAPTARLHGCSRSAGAMPCSCSPSTPSSGRCVHCVRRMPATAEGDDRRRAPSRIDGARAVRKAPGRAGTTLRPVEIRIASVDDLEVLEGLWREFESEVPPAPHVEHDPARELAEIREIAEARLAFLAERGGEAVGFALARRSGARLGRLTDLYVVPDARRGGVAAALVHAVVEELAAHGVEHVDLEVSASNAGARAVYHRWGFGEDVVVLVAPVAALRERLAPGRHAESFASLHVQTDAVADVERAVRAFAPRIGSAASHVSGPRNGWVAVYDEVIDEDPTALVRFARELSSRLGAVVIALSLEVDEVVRMIALDRGGIVDEYLSVPEFYGPLAPGDVIGLAANPTVLARLTGADPQRVREAAPTAASPADLPPAREILSALAAALGLEGALHGLEGANG